MSSGRYIESEKGSDGSDSYGYENDYDKDDDEVSSSSLLSFNNKTLLEEVEDGDISNIDNIEIGDLSTLLGTAEVGGQHDFSQCTCCTDKDQQELPFVRHIKLLDDSGNMNGIVECSASST